MDTITTVNETFGVVLVEIDNILSGIVGTDTKDRTMTELAMLCAKVEVLQELSVALSDKRDYLLEGLL